MNYNRKDQERLHREGAFEPFLTEVARSLVGGEGRERAIQVEKTVRLQSYKHVQFGGNVKQGDKLSTG